MSSTLAAQVIEWCEVPVAVKVQYPGVDDAITADPRNAGMLGSALKRNPEGV